MVATVKITSTIGSGKDTITVNKTQKGNWTVSGTSYHVEGKKEYIMESEDEDGFGVYKEIDLSFQFINQTFVLVFSDEEEVQALVVASKKQKELTGHLVGITFECDPNSLKVTSLSVNPNTQRESRNIIIMNPKIVALEEGKEIQTKQRLAKDLKQAREITLDTKELARSGGLKLLRDSLAKGAEILGLGLLNKKIGK